MICGQRQARECLALFQFTSFVLGFQEQRSGVFPHCLKTKGYGQARPREQNTVSTIGTLLDLQSTIMVLRWFAGQYAPGLSSVFFLLRPCRLKINKRGGGHARLVPHQCSAVVLECVYACTHD